MKGTKKGFTLIELLVSIVVLTVIMSLSFVTFMSINRATLENEYKNVVSYIETKATTYAKETSYLEVSVETLIKEGYISADDQTDIYDPRDKTSLNCHLIKLTYDEYGEFSAKFQSNAYSEKDSDGKCAPYDASSFLDLYIDGEEKLENKWYNKDLSLTLKKSSGESFYGNETVFWQLTNGSTYTTKTVDITSNANSYVDTIAEIVVSKDNIPEYRIIRNIRIDKIAPKIVSINYDKGWTKGSKKDIVIELNDNESGIYGVKIVTNNSCSGLDYEKLNGSTSYKTSLLKGEYYACVMDNAGNVTKSDLFIVNNLDDGIPYINSLNVQSTNSNYNSNKVNISVLGTDPVPGSGVSDICITTESSYNNCIWYKAVNNSITLTDYTLDSLNGSGETLNISAYVSDVAGNISEAYTIEYVLYEACTNEENINTTYGDYTACSKTCGGGTRSRNVIKTDKYTSTLCSSTPEVDNCNMTSCCSVGTYTPNSCTNGYVRERRYNSCNGSYEYRTTTTTCTNEGVYKCNTATKSSVYIAYCTLSLCYDASGNSYPASNITTLNEGTYSLYDCNNGYIRNRRYNSCKENYEYEVTSTSCSNISGTKCNTATKSSVYITYCTSSLCYDASGNSYPASNIKDITIGSYTNYDCHNSKIRQRRYNSCSQTYEYNITSTSCTSYGIPMYGIPMCNKTTNSSVYINYCTSSLCYDSSGKSYSASNITDISNCCSEGTYSTFDCDGSHVRQRRYNECKGEYEYNTTSTTCTNYNTNRCYNSGSKYITYCTSSYCYDSSGNSYSASSVKDITYGSYEVTGCSGGYVNRRRLNNCTGTYEYSATTTSCTSYGIPMYGIPMCNKTTNSSVYITYCTSSLCYDASGNSYTASNITTLNEGTYTNYDCYNSKVRQRRYNSCTGVYEYNTTSTSCTSYGIPMYGIPMCNTSTKSAVTIDYCTSSLCYSTSGTSYAASNIKVISKTTVSSDCTSAGKIRNRVYDDCTQSYSYETTSSTCDNINGERCQKSTGNYVNISWCTSSTCYTSSGSSITRNDLAPVENESCSSPINGYRCNKSSGSIIYVTYCRGKTTTGTCYTNTGSTVSRSNLAVVTNSSCKTSACVGAKPANYSSWVINYNDCWSGYRWKWRTYDMVSPYDSSIKCQTGLVDNQNANITCSTSSGGSSPGKWRLTGTCQAPTSYSVNTGYIYSTSASCWEAAYNNTQCQYTISGANCTQG